MLFAYIMLAPLAVGGIALFLKGRKIGYKVGGLFLFFISLLGLVLFPAISRQLP